jgi:hypothetical protein
METILKADIFFFITSVCTVFVTIFFLVALFYFIKILRNFSKISTIFKNSAEDMDENLREMGEHVRNSPIFTFIFGKEKNKKEPNNNRRSRKSKKVE